ncbi:pyridoxal phosphate-dependent transferase [Fomitopsis serialis]|uniref:pyridoxal phosphate-dependent transferase n=1 Tax=Fomitopsis serialis TaxID=139415 RepID=UPI002007D4C1|nr:pyridoxal phosphate-dependent transferase [Neoantrodia serialis]KAH9920973.1 pyridoxal phosphate-dependent transferase [Neoantrodia serialis]
MGNHHSSSLDAHHHHSRSTAKLLGCTSADAFEIHLDVPHDHDHESTTAASDHDEKRSFDPPPLYAYSASAFPEYQLTWILDALRRSDFSRLDRSGETYVDYMGGSLYPESLIRSKLSSACANEAREAVLSFFRAPPGYTVVFTANATGALKLVGESFPFSEPVATCLAILHRNRPKNRHASPSLFALTGQSNISNSKNSLSLIKYAASQGFHTVLDAAAVAPTSVFSLSETPVDAMAISFYKMFDFLAKLERPWFAGGTVDVVQAPGNIVTMTSEMHERFEDGTINYLNLPAITDGLRFLSAYLPFLPLRLSCLMHHLLGSLTALQHDTTGTPIVRILSRTPLRRLRAVGEQSDTGSVVSLIFLFPSGEMVPNTFIEYAAARSSISLRTGCMCNPGGAASILGLRDAMAALPSDVTLAAFEKHMGHELGVVRISLGLASDFRDVYRVVRFAETIGCKGARDALWEQWLGSKAGEAM